jgi:DNA-binding transcriptional LysR family regulator
MLASRSFWPSFFSRIVARLQWDARAIDLAPDARAWPGLPAKRRRRLTTLFAGFCVAEEAVSEHLAPFPEAARHTSMASAETLMAWAFYLEELGGRPWLLREPGSGTRAMTEEFLARHELSPPMLTMGSNGAIKQAARAGLGVSLQSRAATALELKHGLLETISLREPLPERKWYALWASTDPLREPVREFLDFVTSATAKRLVERSWVTETLRG